MTNKLFYGDNLDVLRDHIASESVDLIYLDPPFNSNASYSILFKSAEGQGSDAQIEAFNDTWTWGPAASNALMDINQSGNHNLHVLMQALHKAIGENAMMAYLAMMAVRLVELHRVLKPTGSLYLHCDPTASHYLKVVLDAVFGADRFQNEISWRRSGRRSSISKMFRRAHDVIFAYTKADGYTFNVLFEPHDEKLIQKYSQRDDRGQFQLVPLMASGKRGGETGQPWRGFDPNSRGRTGMHWITRHAKLEAYVERGLVVFPKTAEGTPRLKYYLEQNLGVPISDYWDDIDLINSMGNEALGYPTQKPVALLERIIAASSNPGDVLLDPFCGCGTAIEAAEKLGRHWIGVDVTHLAIGLVEKRLRDAFEGKAQFETIGVPRDKDSALRLAAEKPHEFQNWFCLKVGGYPLDGGRKGADKGVDGHFYPYENARETTTGVISVKAGRNIGVAMLRDLRGVMEREGYAFGLFLSAYEPTRPMVAEAASAGMHENEFGRFSRLQIITPADIFHGPGPKLPPLAPINRRAPRVETRTSHKAGAQGALI